MAGPVKGATAEAKVETPPPAPVKPAGTKAAETAKHGAPAAEAPKAEAAKAPAPESPADTYSPRGTVFLEAGYQYSGMGLSNTIEDSHTGHGFNGSLGYFYPVSRRWVDLGVKLHLNHGTSTVGLGGEDGNSSIESTTWGIGPVLNFHAVPRLLDISASFLLGSKSLSSDGTVFADNPVKIHIDESKSDSDLKSGTSAFNFGLQLCAGMPALYDGAVRVGLKACYQRDESTHTFKINYASGQDAPGVGVDTANNSFLALLNFEVPLSESDRSPARYSEYYAEKAVTETAKPEAPKAEAAKPAAPVLPAGTKPEVAASAVKSGEISQEVEKSLAAKHGDIIKTLAAGINPKAKNETEKADSYSRAQDVVAQYKASKTEYDSAVKKLAEVKADLEKDPLKSMSDADKKVATEAFSKATADVEKLKTDMEANQKAALEAVQSFFKISGLGTARNKWATATIAELSGVKKK